MRMMRTLTMANMRTMMTLTMGKMRMRIMLQERAFTWLH